MLLKLRHLFIRVARSVCAECEVLVYKYTCGLAASAPLPSRTNVYSGGLPGNPRIASAGRADWV